LTCFKRQEPRSLPGNGGPFRPNQTEITQAAMQPVVSSKNLEIP
jgi:hypothetical protein